LVEDGYGAARTVKFQRGGEPDDAGACDGHIGAIHIFILVLTEPRGRCAPIHHRYFEYCIE
jgi:hypothetical protein